MKNIILAAIGICITMYAITIAFSAFSYEIRKNELENRVSRVVENILMKEYKSDDEEAVKQRLIDELTLDVGINGAVEVQVNKMDLKKGILSVKVIERFRQFNGKEKSIVCEKTAIVEQHTQQNAEKTQLLKSRSQGTAGSVLTNAYKYYQTYGSAMVFEPGADKKGMIYYATRGKLASGARIRYENLGWRVTVRDVKGTVIEQIYYSIEGQYMEEVDARNVNGYRYSLYCVSLENLKSRLSENACKVLMSPDSAVIFDACITIVKNNVRQGAVSDSGIICGKVYTTYNGIVNAQNWSSKTKEALKSYYEKNVQNMFSQVKLICGDGIASVSGAGEYCYGTKVTITAATQRGYTFAGWNGTHNAVSQNYTFTIYGDVTMTATASKENVAIHLYRNLHNKDKEMRTMQVSLSEDNYALRDMGWRKAGHYQSGWSTSRIVAQAYFGVEQALSYEWLKKVAPSVDLYAVWEPNTYTVRFAGNGAEGNIDSVAVKYTDSIPLPSEGFSFEDGKLAGWSFSPDARIPDYICNQIVDVTELVSHFGLEYANNSTITLYAFKEANPKITVRFISEKYYKDAEGNWIAEDAGGLWEDSVWKTEPEYTKLLDALYGSAR